MVNIFSITFVRIFGLLHWSSGHNFIAVLLLAGSMFCPANRAYAAPLPATAQKQRMQQEEPDSVRTLFSGTLLFSPNNGDWIERSEYTAVGRFLRMAQAHPETEIRLTGWADTTGMATFNRQLSAKRAAAVGRYLVRKGIAADRIRTEGLGEDLAAATPREARRVEMRGVITPPRTGNAASEPSDSPNDNGSSAEPKQPVTASPAAGASQAGAAQTTSLATNASAWHIEADTTARSAAGVQTASADGKSSTATCAAVKLASEDSTRQTSAAPDRFSIPSRSVSDDKHAAGEPFVPAPSSSGRYVAVKTNLAAWAGTILNVAADVQIGRHWSVELPVLWCPWFVSDRHAVKTFTIQPEARFWLAHPGKGHFFGIHAHVGWFNVRWNRDRYQDTDRPLLGAGISYGYLLPFSEHWAGEFTLGAGYSNMKYDTYYNIDNGARIDTRTKNYWGITRIGISVVYRFNLKK